MLTAVLLFIVGLVCLIKGGDWFVDGASDLARRFHLPEILIGATVVSIGTTLPEVMVSTMSALSGHGEIAYGNALGSIICNTALIAAVTMAVRPAKADAAAMKKPLLFFFLAAAVYSFAAYVLGRFTRLTGVILLLIFVVYMVVTVRQMTAVKRLAPGNDAGASAADSGESKTAGETEAAEAEVIAGKDTGRAADGGKAGKDSLTLMLVRLIAGAAVIAVGADLLVDNGTLIAKFLGVPESVIALTFVALGTSLPELVTAVTSLMKGHSDLSVGNIIGANVFNLVLVSGVSVTLAPFNVPGNSLIAGYNASLVLDIPVMLLVMLIMALPALFRGRLSRGQGILLLLIYLVYCGIQFML
ncbi:MAG: calcium/sodium antiporter [Lachnospiraceae bacterium]|nr:calcium/sodium antiporter [Lachnospiraceae bacterium]